MDVIPKATVRKHDRHYRVYVGKVYVGRDMYESGCQDLADELNEDESKREFVLDLFKEYTND